jgi:hypothetical protein
MPGELPATPQSPDNLPVVYRDPSDSPAYVHPAGYYPVPTEPHPDGINPNPDMQDALAGGYNPDSPKYQEINPLGYRPNLPVPPLQEYPQLEGWPPGLSREQLEDRMSWTAAAFVVQRLMHTSMVRHENLTGLPPSAPAPAAPDEHAGHVVLDGESSATTGSTASTVDALAAAPSFPGFVPPSSAPVETGWNAPTAAVPKLSEVAAPGEADAVEPGSPEDARAKYTAWQAGSRAGETAEPVPLPSHTSAPQQAGPPAAGQPVRRQPGATASYEDEYRPAGVHDLIALAQIAELRHAIETERAKPQPNHTQIAAWQDSIAQIEQSAQPASPAVADDKATLIRRVIDGLEKL